MRMVCRPVPILVFRIAIIFLQAVTISTNAWTSAGHAVNQIYDILYMMDRDDVAVGVGGEGGILEDGTIQPNVGGYLSIIEQVRIHFFHWNKVLRLFPNTYDC